MSRTRRLLRPLTFLWVTLVAFAAYYALREWGFRPWYHFLIEGGLPPVGAYFLVYIAVGLPIFLGALGLHGGRQLGEGLGLARNLPWGAVLALVAALPMLLGYAAVFSLNPDLTWQQVMTGAVAAAFFEELYFRGFLFGQIFRYTRLGFFPALIVGALVFASGHLYQSQDPATLVGIFFTTFMGAGLFAWLYCEWDYNLWVPIFLHFFMNFFWMLFAAGDNALGGGYANVFRILTIALAILGTLLYKQRQELPLAISRATLWKKPALAPVDKQLPGQEGIA